MLSEEEEIVEGLGGGGRTVGGENEAEPALVAAERYGRAFAQCTRRHGEDTLKRILYGVYDAFRVKRVLDENGEDAPVALASPSFESADAGRRVGIALDGFSNT